MHKNATKCNETLSKWCKNKHGASKIMNTLETYHFSSIRVGVCQGSGPGRSLDVEAAASESDVVVAQWGGSVAGVD
jgi:hypothetical protein